ncbi:MAG TPA: hypothetical protein DDW52_26985 [Planctomycetaceae bacterium]|nr:hypothetical protein [Planctomycetaceae bacterium]
MLSQVETYYRRLVRCIELAQCKMPSFHWELRSHSNPVPRTKRVYVFARKQAECIALQRRCLQEELAWIKENWKPIKDPYLRARGWQPATKANPDRPSRVACKAAHEVIDWARTVEAICDRSAGISEGQFEWELRQVYSEFPMSMKTAGELLVSLGDELACVLEAADRMPRKSGEKPISTAAIYELCVDKLNRAGVTVAGSDSTVRGWKRCSDWPAKQTWNSVRDWLNRNKDYDIGEPPAEC